MTTAEKFQALKDELNTLLSAVDSGKLTERDLVVYPGGATLTVAAVVAKIEEVVRKVQTRRPGPTVWTYASTAWGDFDTIIQDELQNPNSYYGVPPTEFQKVDLSAFEAARRANQDRARARHGL